MQSFHRILQNYLIFNAFFSKILVKSQEKLKISQEKFLSFTCGNPALLIKQSKNNNHSQHIYKKKSKKFWFNHLKNNLNFLRSAIKSSQGCHFTCKNLEFDILGKNNLEKPVISNNFNMLVTSSKIYLSLNFLPNLLQIIL